MLRFAALNVSESDDEENGQQDERIATTKEAKEAEAFTIYNRALILQRSGDGEGAEELFSSLLQHPFLLKARQIADAEEEGSHHPGLPLLYLVHKNMAAAALAKDNLVDAMKSYLEAVKIDASEVTVWYKIGTVAKKIHNYPLAKLAFEQGLQCNENHWPCLDAVITVLYALNNYWVCLEYCGRALERDPYYTKGLVFMRQILKEQPFLRSDTKAVFAYCDPIIHTVSVDAAEAQVMVKECIDIRDKRRELAKQPEPEPLRLPRPITQLTWKCVGECLIELYDTYTTSDPPQSLVLSLDMSDHTALAEGNIDKLEVLVSSQSSTVQDVPSSSSTSTTPITTTTTTTATTESSAHVSSLSNSAENMEVDAASAENISQESVSEAVMDLRGKQRDQSMAVDEAGHLGIGMLENKTKLTEGLAPGEPGFCDRGDGRDAASSVPTAAGQGQAVETKGDVKSDIVLKLEKEITSPKGSQVVSGTGSTSVTFVQKGDGSSEKHVAMTESDDVKFDVNPSPSKPPQPDFVKKESLVVNSTCPSVVTSEQVSVTSASSATLSISTKSLSKSLPSLADKNEDRSGSCPIKLKVTRCSGVYTSVSSVVTDSLERVSGSHRGDKDAAKCEIVAASLSSTDARCVGQTAGNGGSADQAIDQVVAAVQSAWSQQLTVDCGSPDKDHNPSSESAANGSTAVTKCQVSASSGLLSQASHSVSSSSSSSSAAMNVGIPSSLASVSVASLSSARQSASAPCVEAASSPAGKAPPMCTATSTTTTTTTTTPQVPPAPYSPPPPAMPKFQFNTITAQEMQALLQDCVPSTPLLSTPAPASYSSNLVERYKQASPSSSSSSPGSAASAQLQSLARLANLTPSVAVASGAGTRVSPGSPAIDVTAGVGSTAPMLSPLSGQHSPRSSAPVSAEVALQDHVGMGRGSKVARRGAKRKRPPSESRKGVIGPEDYCIKRRSARVRNTRKEEENVDFQKLLCKFLPSSLKQTVEEMEETPVEDSMSVLQVPIDVSVTDLCGGPALEETEQEDVRTYVKDSLKNHGVVWMMYKYLVFLSSADTRLWPAGVAELYLKVYERVRDRLTFPSLFCMDFPEICYSEMFKMTLVWVELTLDAFLVKKAETSVSPSPGQRQGEGSGLPKSQLFSDTDSEEGIQFITGMVESSLVDLLGEKQSHFTVRVYWMKGRWALAENHMDKAVEMLDLVRECLCEEDAVNKVYLPNCRQDKVISLDEVKRQQESLKRCQSLEESQRLFDSKQYQLVVKSLTATFTPVQTTHRVLKPALPERHAQLELLQEALYCLEDWGQCLLWGEVVLDEALHHYRRAPTVSTRDSWALTLVHLLEGLHRVLNKDVLALKSLSLRNLIRLTQNLMRIIEINHDVSEAVTDMPIGSVLPWMVLYRIIRHEENKLEEAKIDDMDSPGSPQAAISSSLMLLSVAHEYLGRNAWCTRENGVFLLFYLNIVKTLLPEAHDSTTDHLNTAFEQCVFCLYGHPNKKGKARHLFDHNAPCIDLTWEQCASVFDYFKPKSLPEIDSYKTSTMSAELENLLRKMYSLIPESEETSQRLDVVHQFIEGNIDNPPSFSSNSPILQELYYLLADYYFKNKEPTKAIKFYLYDVCFNSNRIDSWAGLALSKMAQLEQKLNSMELKIDAPLHKKSIAALRCFSRAVDIDETVRMLWIEYGGLAYQLHSHASRQLRMQLWFPLTPDLLDIAKETRVEMLATARNCYWKASKCEAEGNEEEWLHHYMMGKVMEKQRAHPRLYLEHYKQAAIYLHEDEAKYPRKINYHTSPPHLSLEALEMYYRLHVAVMKHLLRVSEPQTKEDMVLFDRYVTEARESPFALRKEKRYEAQESVSSADDSQCSVTSIPPYSTSHQRPVYHMTPQDHNYSKQKSTSGDTSDASCEVKETGTETDGSQSQSSEETDGVSKCGTQTTRPAERQSDMKGATDLTAEPSGCTRTLSVVQGPESSSVEHESSQVQMVELHAESDSHTTSPLTHAKPLLFEKQVSEGFIPVMDKKGSLSGSTSSSAKPPPFSTPAASIHVLPDDEQIRPAEETMAKADHSSALVTKTDDPIETDSFGDQKLEGGGKIVSHDDVLKTTNPDSKLVDGNSPHGIFSEQKGQPQSILNKAACADSSMKIVLPSDDLSQDNGEESVTSPGLPSSQIYVISSDDDCSSEISSRIPTLKRPRPPLPEQCKRPRLSVGMAEEADGKREKKKTSVVEVEEGVTGDRVEMSAYVQLHEKTQEQVDTVSAPAKSDKAAGNIALDEKNEKQPKTSQPGAGDNIPLGDGTDTKDAKQETKNAADGTVITDIQQYSAHQTRLASEKEGTPTDSGSEKNGDTVMKESGLSSRLQQGQCKEPAGSSESRPAEGYLSKTSKKLAWEHNPLTESYQQTASDGKKPSSVSQHPQPQAVGQLQQTPVSGSDLSEQKPSSAQDGVKPSMSLSESSGKLAEQKCLWAGQGQAQQATLLGEEEYEEWKRKLLNKCADGLHVCLSRFPTHYKSLYRLAYLYFASDSHKNLEYARDLLLGNLDWQNQNHMPSNGLFSDRKSNNFFNGIWKIPIDEIDRSGSFASHVNRSVQLLLEVLCDIGDVTMLHTLHSQLKKKPSDQARKYLRDGERLVLAQMAHSYMLDAVAKLLDRPDRDKTELLLLAFKAYNAHRFGVEAQRAMALLVAAHQRLDLPKQGHGQPVEQAVQYCNSVIASQVMAQKAEKNRLLQQSVGTVTSLTLPSTGFPYTVDAGTTPQRSLVPLIRPLSPGYSVSGRSLPVFPGPHSLTSIAHEVHQSYNTSVQASTLHPAHTPCGRARTLSASSEEHPSALDLSARHQQHVATAALDLSSSSRQRSRPVEPTTQYQKSPSMSPVTKCKVRTDGNVSVASEEGIISSRSIQTLSPVSRQKIHPGIPASSALSPKDLLASPRSGAQHVGSFSPESVRSPGARISLQQRGQCTPPGPGGRVSLQQRAPCTPPSHRGPSSFLSASRGIHLSPSTSTPITPTRPPSLLDDASDCNAASDQGDELFLTSPDKLTSEMRHHMHGNLL